MRVHLIDTLEGFLGLKDEWNRLVECSRMSSVFLVHEWLEAWWKGYAGEADRMQIACVRDAQTGALVGILPAYVHGKGSLLRPRHLGFMGDALGATQLDCLVDPAHEAEALEALRTWLMSSRREWDVFAFRRMHEDSPFLSILAELGSCGLCGRFTVGESVACPEVVLSPTWEQFLQQMSSRERSRIRRWRRELESAGAVGVEHILRCEDLPVALADALRMFERGMSTRYSHPYEVSARYASMLRSASEAFLARGQLRFSFLTVDGQRIAFIWQARHRDKMIGYKTAYDESWAPHHVGNVMFGYAFENAIDEGCSAFNLGVGVSAYKQRFTKNIAQMHEVTCYGRSFAGRLASGRDAVRRLLVSRIRRYAPDAVIEKMERTSGLASLKRL
ncbi:MAG: GNAT family N-acetyltransferase [Coriobacteriia bacterium]|jgi:CelD/BcsL family acetyltransferase involved in cellulose biosynthesis|nr:GNAT family N-acetyltransferase [Coriobacteriia bacterium]